MRVYLDLVIALNFGVDLLLMVGTNRLSGFPPSWKRSMAAAALGGLYAGACLLPGFRFLGGILWRTVSLVGMSVIAFGRGKSAIRRGILFVLLSMALGGIAMGIGQGGFWSLVAGAAGVCVMCAVGFRGPPGSRAYVDVVLRYQGKTEKLLALRDTGNTLRDPVTGREVLIVGPGVAQRLLGLSKAQISSPVETVAAGQIPGLRLIPYSCVGSSGNMLLALRLEQTRIGPWQGSTLVAFAPEGLDGEDTYQALTGGTI